MFTTCNNWEKTDKKGINVEVDKQRPDFQNDIIAKGVLYVIVYLYWVGQFHFL